MSTLTHGRILKAMHKGAVIRVEYTNHPPSSARRVYRLAPGNDPLQEKTIKCLLADSLIKPAADGLFGNDGPVQSYVLFRASEGGA